MTREERLAGLLRQATRHYEPSPDAMPAIRARIQARRQHRIARRAGTAALAVAAAAALVVGLTRPPEGGAGRVAVSGGKPQGSSGLNAHGSGAGQKVFSVAHGVAISLRLPQRTVTAGGTLHGRLVLDNTTGGTVRLGGCPPVRVQLVGPQLPPASPTPACTMIWTLHQGVTTRPVTLTATGVCALAALSCFWLPSPGTYQATISHPTYHAGPHIAVAPPVPVKVVAAPPGTHPAIGVIVGAITACIGTSAAATGTSASSHGHPPSDGGTVVALRGQLHTTATAGGTRTTLLPTDPVAAQTVAPGQHYRFVLPPGHYILDLTHDTKTPHRTPPLRYTPITVKAGTTTTANIPNTCI